jgi:hypothetical protein
MSGSMKSIVSIIIGLFLAFPLAASATQIIGSGGLPPGGSTPTINGAIDITAEATSSAGAYVTFSVTAQDTNSSSLTPVCSPVSGGLFALGTTTVTCTATSAINPASATTTTFGVGVVDTTPPVITPPADQTFATSTFPATPTLTFATATDSVDPSPKISVSITTFSLGTTTVTWTATDASGNSAATTSLVIITDDSATSTATSTSATSTVPSPVTIDLEMYSSTTTLFSGPITVSACPESSGSATSTVNGMCAVDQAAQQNGFAVDWQWFSSGVAIVAAGGEGDWNNGPWWSTFDNLDPMYDALNVHTLSAGEQLLLTVSKFPMKLSVSTSTPEVNVTTTVTVEGFDSNAWAYAPLADALVSYAGSTTTTNASGTVDILATSTNPFTITAQKDGFLPPASVTISPTETATTTQTTSTTQGSGGGEGGGGGGISHSTFDIPLALKFLSALQNTDGSFGSGDSPLITDWTAIAFAAADPGTAKTNLYKYFLTAAPAMTSVTDYERHAMALEAMGINPYSGTPVNYIAPIVTAFDGTQIGDPSLDNDDIFALFPLLHAGYNSSDTIIQKTAAFVLSRETADGSWDESPDMTAAAIDALGPLYDIAGINNALGKAVGYLKSTQQRDGGWSNIDSTSWAQTAINGIVAAQTPGFQTESAWTSPTGYYPTDALAGAQQTDGGVQSVSQPSDTRVWSTSYAVVAAAGKDWAALLQSFSKPVVSSGSGGSAVTTAATTTASTTATSTATTTAQAATTSTSEMTTTPAPDPVAAISEPTPPAVHTARTSRTSAPSITAVAPASPATSTSRAQNQVAAAATAPSSSYMKWLLALILLLLIGVIASFGLKRRSNNRGR